MHKTFFLQILQKRSNRTNFGILCWICVTLWRNKYLNYYIWLPRNGDSEILTVLHRDSILAAIYDMVDVFQSFLTVKRDLLALHSTLIL